jgi:hypothetical protein
MEAGDPRRSAVMGFPQSSHRVSAASGIAGVALSLVAVGLLGTDVPTYDDSPSAFARFYADNTSAIELSALLGLLAAGTLAWFIGFLRWTYGPAEQLARGYQRATPIAFAGGASGIAISVLYAVSHEAAAVAQGTVEPGVVRALDLMGSYSLTAAAVLLSVFMLASFFLIRVTGVLPQWLGWLAMLGSVLGIVQAVLFVAPQDENGLLGALGYAWFLAFVIWVLGASVTLVRRVS